MSRPRNLARKPTNQTRTTDVESSLAGQNNWSTEEMLQRLVSPEAGDAWQFFIHRFTPLLVSVARQYHQDPQRLRDCYLYVCEKLCDHEFARLQAYAKVEGVGFSSWLRAVTANLCVDWLRSEFGRRRRFRAIRRLPELEQAVYEHRFEQGLSISACYETLSTRFPDLTEVQLAGVIRRVNRELTARQHWLLSTRKPAMLPIENPDVRREASLVSGGSENPENQEIEREEQARVDAALRQLEPNQRLLLKLRYQQGLTLKEVARLAHLDDAFQARYQVQLALRRLQELLSN